MRRFGRTRRGCCGSRGRAPRAAVSIETPGSNEVDPAELSGGAQIANFSEAAQPGGWAEYDLTIPTSSTYHFWLRANPCSGIWYSFDQSPLSKLDPAALAKEDRANLKTKGYVLRSQQPMNVAADGTHDARTMTWYHAGTRTLSAGKHTIRFSLGGEAPGTKRFAAIDCFVLSQGAFKPQFQYKPGETPQGAPALQEGESWAFRPARDPFSAAALWDLSQLNETSAGAHGFIGLSPDGNSFVRGDGEPIRFWGGSTYVQSTAQKKKDQRPLIYHARFLAKRGVNLVRLHGEVEPKKKGSRVTDIDPDALDQIYRLVAAMKKAGIYSAISPYWASHARLQESWGVANPGSNNCTGLLFFDPALQRGYKAWLKRIYADVNPYTGVPLAKDPAVAMIQIQNEDSLLFYTSQGIKGQALRNLCKLYGDWLLKKYGSMEKVRDAWQGCAHPDDDLSAGMPGMFIVWELTQDARNKKGDKGGRAARLSDQAEFMSRLMFDFNQEIARYLREELGCRQLINAGNWRTADQVILDDAERFSYTANEVIAKNHYFAGLHKGLNAGWQIRPGQVFTSKSLTTTTQSSPLYVRQVVGHPFIISEGLWVPPSRYQSEGPIIVAAQSCLTGLDVFLWFATGVEDWETTGTKWTFAVPTTLGQFPAAALMFRKAYVREGPVVVHEERGLADVWDRKLPLIAEMGAWDPNRDAGEMPLGTPFKAER